MASAPETLRALPAIFSTADYLRVSGSSDNTAKTALSRLAQRGWIKAAGPRTGLFFNLFVDPRAAENKLLEAVLRTYPSAIIVGAAVLHAHGWTTQIPHVVDIAVLSRPSIKQFEGVHFVERPRRWYADLMKSPDILRTGESPFAIESVSPAFALADARQRVDVWIPDEDDIERREESDGMAP